MLKPSLRGVAVASTLLSLGCGSGVGPPQSSSARGTADFAEYACLQSGYSEAQFFAWYSIMQSLTRSERTEFIVDRCPLSDTNCLVCLTAIGEVP